MAKSGMSESDVSSEKDANPSEKKDNETTYESSGDSIYVIDKLKYKPTTPISLLIESLVKSLCTMYETDEKSATKIYNIICEKFFEMRLVDESYKMSEFEGIRKEYQRGIYHLVNSARGGDQALPDHSTWSITETTKIWSHYFKEFDEIEYIAGGGFGQVFRVKHKLDGTEYAIKKIYIRADGIQAVSNYLSEVKTFASLNHSNIVQYKAAWLELGSVTSDTSALRDRGETYYSYPADATSHKNSKRKDSESDKEPLDDEYIYPNKSIHGSLRAKEPSTDFEISFQHNTNGTNSSYLKHSRSKAKSREKRTSLSEGGKAICTIEEIQNLRLQSKANTKWATLYIQMSLCQLTLKQWLEKKNKEQVISDLESAVALVPIASSKERRQLDDTSEILRHLLKGIEYIHSKKIVHHDIKPSNIFIGFENSSLLVQLGDFGLACPLQSVRHTLALGTRLYAAPEQLNGECNAKSDLYSLGIVLFEMVSSFGTDMERVHCISEVRKGNIPLHLKEKQPQFAKVISELVSNDPNDRPTASMLLANVAQNENDSEVIKSLRDELKKKDEEIKKLKEQLQQSSH